MVVKIPFQDTKTIDAAETTKDAFLIGLLNQFGTTKSEPWLQAIREEAADWVTRLQTPNRRDEEWRFTDLSQLKATNFVAATKSVTQEFSFENQITFVNGLYSPASSNISELPKGVFAGNLTQLPVQYQTKLQKYLAQQDGGKEVFTALNTAGFADVAVIWVAANVVVEKPIQLLFVAAADKLPSYSQPRVLLVAEKSSSLSLVEQYVGSNSPAYFTNTVTEIWLEENSQVNHTRIQQETESTFHIGKTAVSQARDSKYTINTVDLGGKISRHNLQILQTGEQTETIHNGLTVARKEQLADTHSAIALTKPHGKVNQLHKCIIDNHAHAIFNGKIFVPKEAQLTDAAQLNRNLLLSSKARVDTKPELQITADNVKCSHGATVSQLEADELFYLRSRGLSEDNARRLLLDAFAAEIIERIPQSLQAQISQSIVN